MATALAISDEYRRYVHNTPGLIDPVLTRSVRVNWEVKYPELIPEGFPWKQAEGTSKETRKRSEQYGALEANAAAEGIIPDWATRGVKFLEANRVDSSAIMRGLSNQVFIPVKSYAQRRENGRIRLSVVWMDGEKVKNHPVAALLESDPEQAEAWKHRDITDAMRSQNNIWDRFTAHNNPVWDKEEGGGRLFNPNERSLDLTFVGRQELSERKPREEQFKGVVRIRNYQIVVVPFGG